MDTTTTNTYSVYVLCDPTTKVVRYIGLSNNPQVRYLNHEIASRNRDPKKRNHKEKWIAKLAREGERPFLMIVAEGLDLATAKEREIALIAAHSGLVNTTTGGDVSPWEFMTPEQKQWAHRKGTTAARREMQRIRVEEPERWKVIVEVRRQGIRNSEKARLSQLANIKIAQAASLKSEKMHATARENIKKTHEARRKNGTTDKQRDACRANVKKAQAVGRLGRSPAQTAASKQNIQKVQELNRQRGPSDKQRAAFRASIKRCHEATRANGSSPAQAEAFRKNLVIARECQKATLRLSMYRRKIL